MAETTLKAWSNCEMCGASLPIAGENGFDRIMRQAGLIRFPHPPSTSVTAPHPAVRQQAVMVGKLTLNDARDYILSGKG